MNDMQTSDPSLSLALAVIASSKTPLFLVNDVLEVVAASRSFFRAFQLDATGVLGHPFYALGGGEWDEPALRSLLEATSATDAPVIAYEMNVRSREFGVRRILLQADKLDYPDKTNVRLLLAVEDITDARLAERLKDDLIRDKAMLILEVQHRIANSLQIIASLIMQSARRVQSEELRTHLHDAHDRVISIAEVQRHLASSEPGLVALRSYFTQLCDGLSASIIADHRLISINVDVDESVVDGEVSVSLGLLATELVINAVKHAFPSGRSGRVSIEYKSDEAGWVLSVRDDGVGMPESLDARTGLGTNIIEALARQLDAQISIIGHPGTTVTLAHCHDCSNQRESNRGHPDLFGSPQF